MKELESLLKTKTKLPLSKKTVLNITFASILIKDEVSVALKPFDISIEQFNVLRILRGQNGNPLNLQDIQERMISKMSNTTRLVDKLISKDLVERRICEKNRRKVEIFITEKGLKMLRTVDPLIEKTEDDITSSLSKPELEHLNLLLTKLRT